MSVAERIQTIDNAGKIAISDEAQAELGLVPGTHLTELVVDWMLIYVPPKVDVERARELDLEPVMNFSECWSASMPSLRKQYRALADDSRPGRPWPGTARVGTARSSGAQAVDGLELLGSTSSSP